MGYLKKSLVLQVPNPAATASGTLALGAPVANLLGFRAVNSGADASTRIQITDADARVVYLDAADRNYTGSGIDRQLVVDDTATGLTPNLYDPTGAVAAAAEAGSGLIIVASPVTIAWSNNGTAGETLTITVYVEI